jgi:HD-GYP domain-containing protein (c-di-GMP phosphodiesterase class II)
MNTIEALSITQQIEELSRYEGKLLALDIYVNDQAVATQGSPISTALIKQLQRIDPELIRLSKTGGSLVQPDRDIEELVQQKLIPFRAELALEAGVKEDLSLEVRNMATRKVRELFNTCRYMSKVDLSAAADVASDLIKQAQALDSTAFKLHDLRAYDDYTYFHSVNVCVLGITLFRRFVKDEQELLELGIGLLLHDIGKSKVDLAILNKAGPLDEAEYAKMVKHVRYGYELLEHVPEISPLSRNIVLNHHERINGSGYMRQLRENELSLFDMLSSICDVFDAVTTDRSYRAKMDYHRAVSILIRSSGSHFNNRLVNHFLQSIGRFPVGTFVLLSNKEIGVVSKVNGDALSLPVISVIFDEQGSRCEPARRLDLYRDRSGVYIDRPLDTSPLVGANALSEADIEH